jgi:two-component system, sensor histidine kinase and response regulator
MGQKSSANAGIHMKLNVLLVEDNPVNQEVASGMLENLGCQVTIAGDGLEAIQAIVSREFDVVLMDCQMPRLDGYSATQQLRDWERSQQRARTPIIALTANALSGDAEKCLAAGMDAYLSKPFTLQKLQAALAKWAAPVLQADARSA